MVRAGIIFLFAVIFEVVGCYLLWISIREGKSIWHGILGGMFLALYGIVASYQTTSFGRTYVAYGGIFIVASLFWASVFDQNKMDKIDILGSIIILVGVIVLFYSPRA